MNTIVLVPIIVEDKESAKNIIVNSVNYCAGRLMQQSDNVVVVDSREPGSVMASQSDFISEVNFAYAS